MGLDHFTGGKTNASEENTLDRMGFELNVGEGRVLDLQLA